MNVKFWTIDSFTNQLFKGNPAAVFVVDTFPTPQLMQKIATEINLSETAFVVAKPNAHYDIRWFTPLKEVELCGHATLAAAHVLWNELKVDDNPIYFDSLGGILMASKAGHEITLDFPAYHSEPMAVPDGLVEALGVGPVCVSKAHDDCIVELYSFADVVNLQPNIAGLNEIDCRGIIVTADGRAGGQYDFVSRFFAPRVGVTEDPVTGSAHCKLAPYWADRLGKTDMVAYQASKRGGVIKVRYEHNRVHLAGQSVTVLEGRFLNL
ncbi:PhzF family phenazine biosynthesis protein [Candidatus Finniella inopinata]|uniref:PhzF family phenazine biosynthesis protein n=1 Tax=Candidatus Finniella inopinata TaxID=1696036 RepID=A0A4V2DZN7_9PROT|nr:PhzF family phenazine biosynthesis protein [Candidatus Finniella inopinata]RZI45697.1 PhzF family phenazine biosynthesis protein [Candidatus Finniella inopinata]